MTGSMIEDGVLSALPVDVVERQTTNQNEGLLCAATMGIRTSIFNQRPLRKICSNILEIDGHLKAVDVLMMKESANGGTKDEGNKARQGCRSVKEWVVLVVLIYPRRLIALHQCLVPWVEMAPNHIMVS